MYSRDDRKSFMVQSLSAVIKPSHKLQDSNNQHSFASMSFEIIKI